MPVTWRMVAGAALVLVAVVLNRCGRWSSGRVAPVASPADWTRHKIRFGPGQIRLYFRR